MLAEASTIKDDDKRKRFLKWVFDSESKAGLGAMIGLAAQEEGVPVLPEDLNRDPWSSQLPERHVESEDGRVAAARQSGPDHGAMPHAVRPGGDVPDLGEVS